MNQLDQKINASIRLIKTLDGLNPELAYSGGKDSDVILTLAQMADIKFQPIYKMTTIDPPGTIAHVKSKGVEIRKPKLTFFQLIEKKGFPSRFTRFCCAYLKEYPINDQCIIGIRRVESTKRMKRYKEPTQCRIYNKTKHVEQFFPILDWTNEDLKTFVDHFGIKCHSLYYDADGNFDPTKRLGCMCCPLQTDRGLNDFKAHPKYVKAWLKHGQIFWDTHPNGKAHYYFSDIYEAFSNRLFFPSLKHCCLNKKTLFETDWKKQLEEYFGILLE